jgi:enamine deaminase RidA (YjgF/YER057c/UK114 family)
MMRGNVGRIEPVRTCIGVTGPALGARVEIDLDAWVEIDLVAKRPG